MSTPPTRKRARPVKKIAAKEAAPIKKAVVSTVAPVKRATPVQKATPVKRAAPTKKAVVSRSSAPAKKAATTKRVSVAPARDVPAKKASRKAAAGKAAVKRSRPFEPASSRVVVRDAASLDLPFSASAVPAAVAVVAPASAAPAGMAGMAGMAPVMVRQQGAWGLWWLVVITFGVYYYLWYQRINKELTAITGESPGASCQWWSQLIPIYSLVALAGTASRVNRAHEALDSPNRLSPLVTWLWAPIWFGSQTRYLQRRINVLHDVQISQHRRSIPRLPAPLN